MAHVAPRRWRGRLSRKRESEIPFTARQAGDGSRYRIRDLEQVVGIHIKSCGFFVCSTLRFTLLESRLTVSHTDWPDLTNRPVMTLRR
jgi:hypothetical protein